MFQCGTFFASFLTMLQVQPPTNHFTFLFLVSRNVNRATRRRCFIFCVFVLLLLLHQQLCSFSLWVTAGFGTQYRKRTFFNLIRFWGSLHSTSSCIHHCTVSIASCVLVLSRSIYASRLIFVRREGDTKLVANENRLFECTVYRQSCRSSESAMALPN